MKSKVQLVMYRSTTIPHICVCAWMVARKSHFHVHLHVHLLLSSSSSPPLHPHHRLGVGLSPTRIACGTFIMIPDCRLRPVSTSQADKPEGKCPTFSNNPNCHPLLSISMHCCHVYDCINLDLHVRIHGGDTCNFILIFMFIFFLLLLLLLCLIFIF